MNKKVITGAIVVFVVMSICGWIIHEGLLSSTYQDPSMTQLWRPPGEMNMGLIFLVNLIVSYFLSLIFSKGYEGKGIAEGVRFGLYVGLIMATPMAYATYATMPITYSLALQWFIYGLIEYLILGIVLSLVFGKQAAVSPVTAPS
jgi:hypothetical protein